MIIIGNGVRGLIPAKLIEICGGAELVGSRVTCNPPPTDTDQDVLVLLAQWQHDAAESILYELGWEDDGSDINFDHGFSQFSSWSLDDVNIIISYHEDYYKKFLIASHVCKEINALDKQHRITIFQGILYGWKYSIEKPKLTTTTDKPTEILDYVEW